MNIKEAVVFEGLYFNSFGDEYTPADLQLLVPQMGLVVVYDEDGKLIGSMIQLRREVDNCLEALIEVQ